MSNTNNTLPNKQLSKHCLEGNTERSESNPGRCLGTITQNGTAVWKTVPSLTRSAIRFERLWSSQSDEHILVLQDSPIQASVSMAITGFYGHSAVLHLQLSIKYKPKSGEKRQ